MWPDALTAIPTDLPADHRRQVISGGDTGTAQTIEVIRSAVDQGKRDFRIRSLASKIISDCPEKSYECYAAAIHNWIRDNIKYALDPVGVEMIVTPDKLIEAGAGDCDDQCALFASLCESIGLPCRFMTIRADDDKPDEFSHIFSQVRLPGKGWVTSDTTMPNGFGWKPGGFPAKAWPASHDDDSEYSDVMVSGLGSITINEPETVNAFAGFEDTGLEGNLDLQESCNAFAGMGRLGYNASQASQAEQAARQLQSQDPDTFQFIKSMLDGSLSNTLIQKTQTLRNIQRTLMTNQSDPYFSSAASAFTSARDSFNAAVDRYNTFANTINNASDTFGYSRSMALVSNVSTPSGYGLDGLGMPAALIPIAEFVVANPIIAVAIAAIGAVVILIGITAVYLFIQMLLQAFGLIDQSNDLLARLGTFAQQIGQTISNTTTTLTRNTTSIAMLGLAGVGAYLLFKVMKQRGWKMPKMPKFSLGRGKK